MNQVNKMKPHINESRFGSITIESQVYHHDIYIGLDGQIKKRKKKLSKKIYGTSHIISLQEIQYVYNEGARLLILGTGQYSRTRLSDEAADYLKNQKCQVKLFSTEIAIETWNETKETMTIGLFHVTC
jgi:hypothetical protein